MKVRGIRTSLAFVLIFLIATILNGCATTSFRVSPNLQHRTGNTKVLLMPLDIELSTLTAGGLLKPEAEWTARAITHVETSIIQQMAELHVGLVTPSEMAKIAMTPEEEENKTQLIKLHGVVGHSIMMHQYNSVFAFRDISSNRSGRARGDRDPSLPRPHRLPIPPEQQSEKKRLISTAPLAMIIFSI